MKSVWRSVAMLLLALYAGHHALATPEALAQGTPSRTELTAQAWVVPAEHSTDHSAPRDSGAVPCSVVEAVSTAPPLETSEGSSLVGALGQRAVDRGLTCLAALARPVSPGSSATRRALLQVFLD
jgi:hypothetical protein